METLFLRVILLTLCSLFNIRLAFLLFKKGKEDKSAFSLGLVAFFSGLYCLTNAVADLSWKGPFSYETKLFWTRATWTGILAVAFYLIFLFYFTKRRRHIKLKIFLSVLPTLTFLLLALSTPYLIESLKVDSEMIEINTGKLDTLARYYFVILILFGLALLLEEYFKSKGFRRLQIKYLVAGFTVYSLGGLVFAGILPLVTGKTDPYVDISAVLSSVWVGLTSYAIVRYQLMNIKMALGRIMAFSLSFITLIAGIALLTYIYSQSATPPNFYQLLPIALLLTLAVFQLNKFYEELGETIFYPGFFKRKTLVSNLEKELGSILEMKTFSRLIVDTFEKAFKTNNIAVITYKPSQKKFNIQKVLGFERKEIINIPENNLFLSVIRKVREPFSIQEMTEFSSKLKNEKDKEKLKEINEKLQKARVEVVIPLFFEKKIIGIVFLGEKYSLDAFSKEDMEILASFSRQASIALRNTLLYSEIKKRKEELENFYRLTVEKEIKITQLKKRISELEKEIKNKE